MSSDRGRQLIDISLGTYSLEKRDIRHIEKIILKRLTPSDYSVRVGKPRGIYSTPPYEYDTAKDLPGRAIAIRHIELRTKAPNMSVRFQPYSTRVAIQRVYSKDERLKALNDLKGDIERYFVNLQAKGKRRKRFLPNRIIVR